MSLSARIYEFGDYRLDTQSQTLHGARDGRSIALTARAYKTLLVFLESPGVLLDKQTLMSTIWPQLVVEENNLDQQISHLRQLLAEQPGQNRYIATVRGRGYRFVAAVAIAHPPAVPTPAVSSDELVAALPIPPWRKPAWLAAAVAVVAVAAAALQWWPRAAPPAPVPRTLAVLPFRPLAAASQDASLELGMAETLIVGLTRNGLAVRPRGAVRRYAALDRRRARRGTRARHRRRARGLHSTRRLATTRFDAVAQHNGRHAALGRHVRASLHRHLFGARRDRCPSERRAATGAHRSTSTRALHRGCRGVPALRQRTVPPLAQQRGRRAARTRLLRASDRTGSGLRARLCRHRGLLLDPRCIRHRGTGGCVPARAAGSRQAIAPRTRSRRRVRVARAHQDAVRPGLEWRRSGAAPIRRAQSRLRVGSPMARPLSRLHRPSGRGDRGSAKSRRPSTQARFSAPSSACC